MKFSFTYPMRIRDVIAGPLGAALIALSLCFALAACATRPDGTPALSVANPISNARLASIEAGYGVVLTGVNAYVQNYRDGYRCTIKRPESLSWPCSRRSVVTKMQGAVRIADAALGRARTFITQNPQLDPTSLIDAFEAAVGTVRDINERRA